MRIKTIDLNAKEWFDKVNGNSYFSGNIVINFGMKSQNTLEMLFQYGYDESYVQVATEVLAAEWNRYIVLDHEHQPLWSYCRENNIILRTFKQDNCLKRDLN